MTRPHLILFYDYVEDILERRTPHREAHLARIAEWIDAGRMTMAGALGDPPSGAAFVIPGSDPAEAERFAAGDPYVVAGLVAARRVVPWTVVASA
jgi:uncharacterized protein YciI